jgi:hypothetical protein
MRAASTQQCPSGLSRKECRKRQHTCRIPRFADPLPEGGASYAAAIAIDNAFEERRDACYKPGSVPAIVRCKGMYESEYMQRSREALPAYRQALLRSGALAARVPASGQDYRQSSRVGYNSDYVQYARSGFARGAHFATDCSCIGRVLPNLRLRGGEYACR